jgi:hypothetical protein
MTDGGILLAGREQITNCVQMERAPIVQKTSPPCQSLLCSQVSSWLQQHGIFLFNCVSEASKTLEHSRSLILGLFSALPILLPLPFSATGKTTWDFSQPSKLSTLHEEKTVVTLCYMRWLGHSILCPDLPDPTSRQRLFRQRLYGNPFEVARWVRRVWRTLIFSVVGSVTCWQHMAHKEFIKNS